MSIIIVILSIAPVVWLFLGLLKFKLPLYKVSVSAVFLAAVIAITVHSMPVVHMLQATAEGALLALFPIVWVVVAALFVYRVTLDSGAMEKIKDMLSSVTQDRRAQALVIAFAFGGFLEAVAGFGTAVVIPAGILISMGFQPMMATVVCLVANTIPVAFGVIGLPIITLSQVTSLPVDKLSFYTALQLTPFLILLPLVLSAIIAKKPGRFKGIMLVSMLSGTIFAALQLLAAFCMGPELACVIASLAALVFLVFWLKRFPVSKPWRFSGDEDSGSAASKILTFREMVVAWSPYLFILVGILSISLIPQLEFLRKFPFAIEQQIYFGEGGKAVSFELAASGGTILFLSGLIGGLIQGLPAKKILSAFINTIKQSWGTTVIITSIVALAKIMSYSGMTVAISSIFIAFGFFFPFVSPFLGALGTFITGSNTSSNILFGTLQTQTAGSLGMSREWIAAANASGATAGKMISPQSISIAAAGTGLQNEEGKILGIMLKYCFVYSALLGLIVSLQALIF